MDQVINSITPGEEVTIYTAGGPVTGTFIVPSNDGTVMLRYDFQADYQIHTVLRSAIVAVTRTFPKWTIQPDAEQRLLSKEIVNQKG